MSWLDSLKPASFGGVPFGVFTVQWEAGDSTVVREYPFEDVPSVFRMGAAAQRLRFSAFVAGDDYQVRKDALIAVLTGERVLVHPTSGSMRATALGFRFTEAPLTEGGIVKFELEFVLTAGKALPTAVPYTQGQVVDAATAAKGSAVDQFGAEFSLASAPAWVQARVLDRLTNVLGGAWERLRAATAGLGDYSDGITGAYQLLRDGLSTAVNTPASFAGSLRGLFELPSVLSDSSAASLRGAYESLFGYSSKVRKTDFEVSVPAAPGQLAMYGVGQPEALGVDTAARLTQARLDGAVDRLVDTLAVAAWLETVAAVDLPGYDQAQAWRATLFDHCTRLMVEASVSAAPALLPATNWHDAMQDLLTAGLADLQSRGRDQARLSTFTPRMTYNIWSLSYLLYGTAVWADELMLMNPHITHPLLVPAGKELKVVDHG